MFFLLHLNYCFSNIIFIIPMYLTCLLYYLKSCNCMYIIHNGFHYETGYVCSTIYQDILVIDGILSKYCIYIVRQYFSVYFHNNKNHNNKKMRLLLNYEGGITHIKQNISLTSFSSLFFGYVSIAL